MTGEQRAQQTWQVLISAAHQRQTVTYQTIGQLVGGVPAQGLAKYRDTVAAYCRAKDLPPLTVLAVSKVTGRPGAGYSSPGGDVDSDREQVYGQNWYGLEPPQVSDFETDAG